MNFQIVIRREPASSQLIALNPRSYQSTRIPLRFEISLGTIRYSLHRSQIFTACSGAPSQLHSLSFCSLSDTLHLRMFCTKTHHTHSESTIFRSNAIQALSICSSFQRARWRSLRCFISRHRHTVKYPAMHLMQLVFLFHTCLKKKLFQTASQPPMMARSNNNLRLLLFVNQHVTTALRCHLTQHYLFQSNTLRTERRKIMSPTLCHYYQRNWNQTLSFSLQCRSVTSFLALPWLLPIGFHTKLLQLKHLLAAPRSKSFA